jgi:hypothetical protein
MNKIFKKMTDEEAYSSFRSFEREINEKYNAGLITGEKARKAIANARMNYSKLNYNREVDKIMRDLT